MNEYLDLFLTFLKIGIMTFGGGYAMIPVVERELIKKKGWTTMEEVMEYYTIAQITPGIIMVNLATFVGFKQKGVLGGIIATIGVVLPGVSIIIVVAILISNFSEIAEVQHAFAGIRIAVGALILYTVIKLAKEIFKDIKAIIIYIIVFCISVSPRGILPALLKSPVLLVVVSGAAGLFIYRQKKPDDSGSGVPPSAGKEQA